MFITQKTKAAFDLATLQLTTGGKGYFLLCQNPQEPEHLQFLGDGRKALIAELYFHLSVGERKFEMDGNSFPFFLILFRGDESKSAQFFLTDLKFNYLASSFDASVNFRFTAVTIPLRTENNESHIGENLSSMPIPISICARFDNRDPERDIEVVLMLANEKVSQLLDHDVNWTRKDTIVLPANAILYGEEAQDDAEENSFGGYTGIRNEGPAWMDL